MSFPLNRPHRLRSEIFLGYILTVLLVYLQGSVLLSGSRLLLILFLIIAVTIFVFKKIKLDKFIFIVLLFLLIISIVQFFSFNYISSTTLSGTLVRFLLPYFFIKIINKNYLQYFVNVMYFFTLISLLLYIPSLLFPSFYDFLLNLSSLPGSKILTLERNLILYTVETDIRLGFLRNSGLFWEPGAFSGFLVVAILCNIVLNKNLWDFKNVIFLFAIIQLFPPLVILPFFRRVFILHGQFEEKYFLLFDPFVFIRGMVFLLSVRFPWQKNYF